MYLDSRFISLLELSVKAWSTKQLLDKIDIDFKVLSTCMYVKLVFYLLPRLKQWLEAVGVDEPKKKDVVFCEAHFHASEKFHQPYYNKGNCC